MTATAPVLERIWSRRHWLTSVAVALGAQVALVFLLSSHSGVEPRRDASATVVKLVDASFDSASMDPTLFALANPNGFSGRAWLHQPRPQHSLNDWQEPERWLSIPIERFTDEFRSLARTNLVRSVAAVEQPPVRIVAAEQTTPARPAVSELLLSPALAQRGVLSMPEAPALPSADVLADSVVQVVVNRLGDVFSARLISSSGSKAADAKAIELSSQARFKPVGKDGPGASPAGEVAVGNLVYHWQIIAPPVAKSAKPVTP